MSESGIAVKPLCKEVSCGCELLADKSEAKEPGSHCVLGVFGLLRLGACGADFLRHLGKGEAKLNVALKLSGVKPVLLAVRRCIKLEEPELDRAFGEGGVEV